MDVAIQQGAAYRDCGKEAGHQACTDEDLATGPQEGAAPTEIKILALQGLSSYCSTTNNGRKETTNFRATSFYKEGCQGRSKRVEGKVSYRDGDKDAK